MKGRRAALCGLACGVVLNSTSAQADESTAQFVVEFSGFRGEGLASTDSPAVLDARLWSVSADLASNPAGGRLELAQLRYEPLARRPDRNPGLYAARLGDGTALAVRAGEQGSWIELRHALTPAPGPAGAHCPVFIQYRMSQPDSAEAPAAHLQWKVGDEALRDAPKARLVPTSDLSGWHFEERQIALDVPCDGAASAARELSVRWAIPKGELLVLHDVAISRSRPNVVVLLDVGGNHENAAFLKRTLVQALRNDGLFLVVACDEEAREGNRANDLLKEVHVETSAQGGNPGKIARRAGGNLCGMPAIAVFHSATLTLDVDGQSGRRTLILELRNLDDRSERPRSATIESSRSDSRGWPELLEAVVARLTGRNRPPTAELIGALGEARTGTLSLGLEGSDPDGGHVTKEVRVYYWQDHVAGETFKKELLGYWDCRAATTKSPQQECIEPGVPEGVVRLGEEGSGETSGVLTNKKHADFLGRTKADHFAGLPGRYLVVGAVVDDRGAEEHDFLDVKVEPRRDRIGLSAGGGQVWDEAGHGARLYYARTLWIPYDVEFMLGLEATGMSRGLSFKYDTLLLGVNGGVEVPVLRPLALHLGMVTGPALVDDHWRWGAGVNAGLYYDPSAGGAQYESFGDAVGIAFSGLADHRGGHVAWLLGAEYSWRP